jgi:aminoglycoside phosphotransferase (APT) family kinase protein
MTIYSQRLGDISGAQFEAAAERFALGRFVKAEPITSGLFGQNVFLTTTAGEFVLRGAPHWVKGDGDTTWRREDRWQFTKEKLFARLLHARTDVPVPWPMHHDETSDIFGWPYLVMPRMPGLCTDERGILALAAEDRYGVAVAVGKMLAQMQTLTSPFAGDVSPASIALEPYPHGAVDCTTREARAAIATCERLTRGEIAWIEAAADAARSPVPSRIAITSLAI